LENKIGLFHVWPVSKTGTEGQKAEVVSRMIEENELLKDEYFVKKCLKACKLKEKPFKFAVKLIKQIEGL
jgi:hypothetical protein